MQTLTVVVVIADQSMVEPTEREVSFVLQHKHGNAYYWRGCFQKNCPSPPVVMRWSGSLPRVSLRYLSVGTLSLQAPNKVRLFLVPGSKGIGAWYTSRTSWKGITEASGLIHELPCKYGRRILVTFHNRPYIGLCRMVILLRQCATQGTDDRKR